MTWLLSFAVGAVIPYVLLALFVVYDRVATWLYWRKRLARWDEAARQASLNYMNGARNL